MILENWIKISAKLSRYHSGWRRYIGGETRMSMSGLALLKSDRAPRIDSRTGSTRAGTSGEDERTEMSVRKLVRQATMQALEAVLMDRRLSARVANLRQEITWQLSIRGLARRFNDVMFR